MPVLAENAIAPVTARLDPSASIDHQCILLRVALCSSGEMVSCGRLSGTEPCEAELIRDGQLHLVSISVASIDKHNCFNFVDNVFVFVIIMTKAIKFILDFMKIIVEILNSLIDQ